MKIQFDFIFIINFFNIFCLSFCDKTLQQYNDLSPKGQHNSTGKIITLPGGWKVHYTSDANHEKRDNKTDINLDFNESIDEEFEDKNNGFNSFAKEFDDNFDNNFNENIDKDFQNKAFDSFESIDNDFEELNKNDPQPNEDINTVTKNKNILKVTKSSTDNREDNVPGISIETDPDFDSKSHFDNRLMQNDPFLDGLKLKWDFTHAHGKPGKKFDDFYIKYDEPLDAQQKEFISLLNKLKELDKNMKSHTSINKDGLSIEFNDNMDELNNNNNNQFGFSVNDPNRRIDINLGKKIDFDKNDMNFNENHEKNDKDFEIKDNSLESLDKDFEEFNKDIEIDDNSMDNFEIQFHDNDKLSMESIDKEFGDKFDDQLLQEEQNIPMDSMDKEFEDKLSDILSDKKSMESIEEDLNKVIELKKDNKHELKKLVIKKPGIDFLMKYIYPKGKFDFRPITRTHVIRTEVKPKNRTQEGNAPKIFSEDIEIYEYFNPEEKQSIPVIIKTNEKTYDWSDYSWVALVAGIYFSLIIFLYMKCMRTSKCWGKCEQCDDCGECCDEEEKDLLKEKKSIGEHGWFDSLAEMRMFKLKHKRNRKLSNYQRMRQLMNE